MPRQLDGRLDGLIPWIVSPILRPQRVFDRRVVQKILWRRGSLEGSLVKEGWREGHKMFLMSFCMRLFCVVFVCQFLAFGSSGLALR